MAGDEAYQSSDFLKATGLYRESFSRIPDGTATKQLKEGARERYAQAAVQAARVKNRSGDRAGAIQLLDEVLDESVFPTYQPALTYRAKLDDPITTNPSATIEHGRKVDEVRRMLYLAEGEYNLGNFDKALQGYQDVLSLDPYNKAARRGMERANAAISDYADAARDQTRAELLSQVSANWELNTPKDATGPLAVGQGGVILDPANSGPNLKQKLDNLIVPQVVFEDATIEDAIEYLQAKAREIDPEIIEERRGISFVLSLGSRNDSPEIAAILSKRFSLRLQNVPLREVVKYVADQTGTGFVVEPYAVVFRPLAGLTDELIVRRYSVPPTFLSQSSSASSGQTDVFSDAPDSASKLAPRLTAQEYLESTGVPFPQGATASYSSVTNELIVKSTAQGQDLVSSVVDAINSREPIAVVIETKFIRITQETLEELSFDTALDGLNASGNLLFGGGTVGNGVGSSFDSSPISSGLRSGDFATSGDPINSLLDSGIAGSDALSADSQAVAPGFLSILGQVDANTFGVLLRGFNQKKGTDVMVQPSVVTRSGEQATINSTRELIYPTEYEPPELPNSVGITDDGAGNTQASDVSSFPVTPAHPTAFETRPIGVQLEVQPTVSEDRSTVSLTLAPRVDEFLGFINYGTPILSGSGDATANFTTEVTSNEILMPIFDVMKLNTTVEVANGNTLLLGGLLSESVEMVEDKVPILGSIPLIGKLFTSESHRREKTAVMIFVTVRIVDPSGKEIQTRN